MSGAASRTLLEGIRAVSLSINTPGPVAAARLAQLGAAVTKVEPPSGDPLKKAARGWYESLCKGQTVLPLDLKNPAERARLDELLASQPIQIELQTTLEAYSLSQFRHLRRPLARFAANEHAEYFRCFQMCRSAYRGRCLATCATPSGC